MFVRPESLVLERVDDRAMIHSSLGVFEISLVFCRKVSRGFCFMVLWLCAEDLEPHLLSFFASVEWMIAL